LSVALVRCDLCGCGHFRVSFRGRNVAPP
jgi:hypothetical protein